MTILAFIVAAALLTLSPGPDTMLVLRNTLRGGRGDGWRTTLGISSGLLVHATLSSAGLSIILVRSATAFSIVKLLGAGYLIWLGAKSLGSAMRGDVGAWGRTTPHPHAPTSLFYQGFLTNVLNPKVAVFYLAFLPQFIAPGEPVLAKSLLLASIHIGMGLVWLSMVSAAVDRAQRFVTSGRVRRWLDAVCGAVLVGLGLKLALARR